MNGCSHSWHLWIAVKWTLCVCAYSVAQACQTLCSSGDCSPPGSSVHGVFSARMLEWVAISSARGSSWSRDWTCVSWIAGRFFTRWATRGAQNKQQWQWKWYLSECPVPSAAASTLQVASSASSGLSRLSQFQHKYPHPGDTPIPGKLRLYLQVLISFNYQPLPLPASDCFLFCR